MLLVREQLFLGTQNGSTVRGGIRQEQEEEEDHQDEGQQEAVLGHIGKRQLPCAADSRNDPVLMLFPII